MKYSKIKILNHLYQALILSIIITSSSCGFQGRKYTTGHYWNGRNQLDYDTQNKNEELNANKNEKENAINQSIVSEETFSSKIDDINSAVVIKEEQKLTAPASRFRTNNWVTNKSQGTHFSAETNHVVLETDTVPSSLLNMHKPINRQVIWGLVISSFSFDIFVAVLGLGIQEPDLIFIPIVAFIIFPFFFIPKQKKIKSLINNFEQELEKHKSENSKYKWFKKESRFLHNVDSLQFFMLTGSIIFSLLSLLMIYIIITGG